MSLILHCFQPSYLLLLATTAIKEFPRRETTKRMQRAMVSPIWNAARLYLTEQIGASIDAFVNRENQNDAFIVAFMLVDRCVMGSHPWTVSIQL